MSSAKSVMAQVEPEDPMVKLGGRMDELMEMAALAQTYKFTDYLSYDISSQFADSANISNPLEQSTGNYRSFNELFWGAEGSVEFLQGEQYYLQISHEEKRIYVHDRLNYSRMINVPLVDSLFNQSSLMDLSIVRPGGVYKKLTIQYFPGSQYKQVEITYDSTNYSLQTVKYYFNSIAFSDGFETCQTISDTLVYPSTGVAKPSHIINADIIQYYKNFIAEFPNHTKGATVRIFIPSTEQSTQGMMQTEATSRQSLLMQTAAPLPDTINAVSMMSTAMSMTESVTGVWVDSTMNARQLFEWYMSAHLNLTGYTYENITDWVINTCGYKLNQLPWSDEMFVRQDTLQSIWNRFAAKYPAGLLTILDTVNVPIVKSVNIQTDISSMTYSDGYVAAMTWTNGDWYTQRMSNVFNLSIIPYNATIQNATMNLYGWKDSWITAAHFRNTSDAPYMQAMMLGASCIPGLMDFSTQPEVYPGGPSFNFPVSNANQVATGNPTDFWSNQDFPDQNITSMVQALYSQMINRGISFPLLYKLNDETLDYKRYVFGGPQAGNGKAVTLSVISSSPRQDFFAAFVNRALGTYLTFAGVQSMYALYGKLVINADASNAVSGPGCAGETATPFTGVKTVNFSNRTENAFDTGMFGESKFIYKQGEIYYPTTSYQDYEVIRALE